MTNVNIQMYPSYVYSGGVMYAILFYQATEYNGMPYVNDYYVQIGSVQDLTTTPLTFTDASSALSYYESLECGNLLSIINTSAGATAYTSYTATLTPPSVAAVLMALSPVAFSDNYSDLLGDPILATVATSGSYNDLSSKPTIPMVPTNVSAFTNDANYITASALSGYETTSALSSALSSYVTSAALSASLSGYVTSGALTTALTSYVSTSRTINGHALSSNITVAYSDLTGLPSIPAAQVSSDWSATSGVAQILNKPKVYNLNSGASPSLRANPVEVTGSATVSSGSIVIYLTADGTSTGTALFPNGIDYMKAEVSSATASYNYAYTLSNSNKTLTIGVDTVTVALGLISFNSAANGVSVNIFIKGY